MTPVIGEVAAREQAEQRQRRKDRMTGRAQAYLVTTMLMHGGIGWFCFFRPESFLSPSYDQLKQVFPLAVWGVGFAIVATLGGIAAVRRSEGFAYACLILAVILTCGWASGFMAAATIGEIAGPTGPISWTALALKDLIQCRMPLRVPLEPVVRDLLAEDERQYNQAKERRRIALWRRS